MLGVCVQQLFVGSVFFREAISTISMAQIPMKPYII